MGVIIAMGIVIASIFGAVASQLLTDEFKAWTPWIVNRFVERAKRRLPEEYRERFGEEWRSDIDETPGSIGKLLMAAGLHPAASKIESFARTTLEAKRKSPTKAFLPDPDNHRPTKAGHLAAKVPHIVDINAAPPEYCVVLGKDTLPLLANAATREERDRALRTLVKIFHKTMESASTSF
jgi:hypothetical protein